MMPPKEDHPGKGPPPKAPEPAAEKKTKSRKLASFVITGMPPAESHDNRLVAVTDDTGVVLGLAYSDGKSWLSIEISGELTIPANTNTGVV